MNVPQASFACIGFSNRPKHIQHSDWRNMQVFIGICFVVTGYVYPFVVVFWGGSLSTTIRNIWLLLIFYIVFLCFFVPGIVAALRPEMRNETVSWVPDTPNVVPVVLGGWMAPLIGGGLGFYARRRAIKRFPEWMNRNSFRSSSNDDDGSEKSKDQKGKN